MPTSMARRPHPSIRSLRSLSSSLCRRASAVAPANPPVASYIFPAGGQRGTTVTVRVGGLFLHESCGFELLGPGVDGDAAAARGTQRSGSRGRCCRCPTRSSRRTTRKDMAGDVAHRRRRPARRRAAGGCGPPRARRRPEVRRRRPARSRRDRRSTATRCRSTVTLPVTINGRIFPRENVDVWTFAPRKGPDVTCEVNAARLGSPLDARLEVLDPDGRRPRRERRRLRRRPAASASPPRPTATIRSASTTPTSSGGQAYVYRLTHHRRAPTSIASSRSAAGAASTTKLRAGRPGRAAAAGRGRAAGRRPGGFHAIASTSAAS